MNRKYILILILLLASIQYSCKKETIIYATTADQVAKQLQKVIADHGITRVIAWDNRAGFPSVTPNLGVSWTFSNGFITIIGYGFDSNFSRNLQYLDYYDISKVTVTDGTSPVALILHFSN